jgi:hypothetical protein
MINITVLKTDNTQEDITVKEEGLLETLQGIVGGYIEVIRLDPDSIMVVNEEGWLKKLPLNFKASKQLGGHIILGNVVVINDKDLK